MQYVLLICFIFLSAASGIECGTYVCKEKGDTYTLIINKDSSFSYARPGVIDGIITETGIWKTVGSSMFLIDSVYMVHSKSSTTGFVIQDQNHISIKVLDEKNNPFSGIDVALNEDGLFKKTDNEGVVIFGYGELKTERPDQPKQTVEIVEVKAKQWAIKTLVSNHFSNAIIIVHDLHPVEIAQPRVRKLLMQKKILIFSEQGNSNENKVLQFKKMD